MDLTEAKGQMEDIQLLEKCSLCGEHLIIHVSKNLDTNELWVVKRCMACKKGEVTQLFFLTKLELQQ